MSLEPAAGFFAFLPCVIDEGEVFGIEFIEAVESDSSKVVLPHLHLNASDNNIWVNWNLMHDLWLVSILAKEEGRLIAVCEDELDAMKSLMVFDCCSLCDADHGDVQVAVDIKLCKLLICRVLLVGSIEWVIVVLTVAEFKLVGDERLDGDAACPELSGVHLVKFVGEADDLGAHFVSVVEVERV